MKTTIEEDRSRRGSLVHSASAHGRHVRVVAYVEGIDDAHPRYEIESMILCRTAEQAREIARLLGEAKP